MTLWHRMIRWIDARRNDRALREELEAHRAHAQGALERAGMRPADAEVESRRQMGNALLAREDSRDVWAVRWIDQLRQHLRYGARGLRREPAFALTAILTLALGTTAMTTVFSVVDAEIWRPLPFTDSRRLVNMASRTDGPDAEAKPISIADLGDWRAGIPSMAGIAGEGRFDRRTIRLDHAESATSAEVTANFFDVLGRRAMLGRVFTADDALGGNAVVVTERGWRRIFGADPSVVGRTFKIDDQAKMLVGVVATNDSLHPEMDLFIPIDERVAAPDHNAPRFYGAIGRLQPDATIAIAREQLRALLARRAATFPAEPKRVADVGDLSTFYKIDDKRPLYFFLGTSALVLILTIVNVAALFLSRTLRRAPEFALRGALGGGTRVVALQLVTEGALIAVPGCLLGLFLAYQAIGAAGSVIPDDFLIRGSRIGIDLRVAAFSFLIAMATTAGLALVPWGLARRASIAAALGSGGRTGTTAAAGRTRAALLTAQLALTVVLLAGAGMFVKSFTALMHVPLGFDPSSAWSARVALTGPRYASRPSPSQPGAPLVAYAGTLVEHARAIPGVRAAAVAAGSPLMSGSLVMATNTGEPTPASGGTRALLRTVGDGYFDAIGTRIVSGRGIAAGDVWGAEPVAVINERMAHDHFAGADPIGKQIDLGGRHAAWFHDTSVRIVGVAADIKDIFLNENGMPNVYVSFAQQPSSSMELIVRGNGSADSMGAALRAAAAAADPAIPVTSVYGLDRRVTLATARERFNLFMVAGFAVIAVLIAAIGIYGAMAYASTARQREYGVRLALGATPGGLLGDALWRAVRVGLIGGAVGIAGAIAMAIWIGDALYLVPGSHNGLLFNVNTTDPVILLSAMGGVVFVALIAGALPARRVARVDPVKALRTD
jgi:predicted permease